MRVFDSGDLYHTSLGRNSHATRCLILSLRKCFWKYALAFDIWNKKSGQNQVNVQIRVKDQSFFLSTLHVNNNFNQNRVIVTWQTWENFLLQELQKKKGTLSRKNPHRLENSHELRTIIYGVLYNYLRRTEKLSQSLWND